VNIFITTGLEVISSDFLALWVFMDAFPFIKVFLSFMGSGMSSESNNGNVQERRTGFLDKVEKDRAPESPVSESEKRSACDTKPRGTFLEPSTDSKSQPARKPAPCSSRGG
jgi:hypothetical protein